MPQKNEERLQKYLAECGVASRRKSEELIAAGKVKVNGHVAQIGDKIDPRRDLVTVRGKKGRKTQRNYYILLHKPRGYVTTVSDELGRKTVMDLVRDIDARLYPVGRLDKDSEGLLLLTNDGAFANALTHPRHAYSKKYRVTIHGKVDDSALLQLREGIDLDGRMTAPCDVTVLTAEENRTVLEFVLHEGRNRQIRRMCDYIGFPVRNLKRIKFGTLSLKGLSKGKMRELNEDEAETLKKAAKLNG